LSQSKQKKSPQITILLVSLSLLPLPINTGFRRKKKKFKSKMNSLNPQEKVKERKSFPRSLKSLKKRGLISVKFLKNTVSILANDIMKIFSTNQRKHLKLIKTTKLKSSLKILLILSFRKIVKV
jgi:mRNA-degrading endonuclease YafQ of YafQ-DinJ toxin-antitoxin module